MEGGQRVDMAVLRIVNRKLIRWKVGSVLVCWYGSVDNCQPHFDNMEGGQRADMAVPAQLTLWPLRIYPCRTNDAQVNQVKERNNTRLKHLSSAVASVRATSLPSNADRAAHIR